MISLIYVFLVTPCIVSSEETYYRGEIPDEVLSRIQIGDRYRTVASYLKTFGYNSRGEYASQSQIETAIKKFQFFSGVVMTGQMDRRTITKMQQPRCGDRDPDVSGNLFDSKRRRRYNKQGTSWTNRTLTWRYFENAETISEQRISKVQITDTIKAAMALWEKETNIAFVHAPNDDDPVIKLEFLSGKHGDPFAFDGKDGVLAHAFYPGHETGYAGDVHFDNEDKFSVGIPQVEEKDLMWVVTHELGHSLGLDHSYEQDAIMYPWYSGYKKDLKLENDDTNGIRSIYGTKDPVTKPTPKPVAPLPKYKTCPRTSMTAIWYSTLYNRYFFITQEQKLYSVMDGGLRDGPILVSNYFPENDIPSPIDAVLQLDEYNVIFAGKQYFVYKDFEKKRGAYPLIGGKRTNGDYLEIQFPTRPFKIDKVDAAMKWRVNGKIYFFINIWYWRYDERRKMFDRGYPQPIPKRWKGIPGRIDAAYSSVETSSTFFVIGNLIYEFDDELKRLKDGYPKDIRKDKFKCVVQAEDAIIVTPPPTTPKKCPSKPIRCHGPRCRKRGGHRDDKRRGHSGRGRDKHRQHGKGKGRKHEHKKNREEQESECEQSNMGERNDADFP